MAEPTKLPIATKSENQGLAAAAPGAPFSRLRREIDRLFESFGHPFLQLPFERSPFAPEAALPRLGGFGMSPAVDLIETEKDYRVSAELPGIDEKDIVIKVSNGTLSIKGEKTEEKSEQDTNYYLSERSYGSFMRSFQIPPGVDKDKIEASFAKGVLTVTLPKTSEAQAQEKQIEVKAA